MEEQRAVTCYAGRATSIEAPGVQSQLRFPFLQ